MNHACRLSLLKNTLRKRPFSATTMPFLSLIGLTACPQLLSSKFRLPSRAPAVRLIQLQITKISASSTPIPTGDRLISAASYFFPLLSSIQHSHCLFDQYPIMAVALKLKPLTPIFVLYHNLSNFFAISFLALYVGVALNPIFSRYVRFNALHALALYLLTDLPLTAAAILFRSSPDRSGLWLKLTLWGYNALFLLLVAGFIHGLICSVLGKTPYWPFVSEAADKQLKHLGRPFFPPLFFCQD